MKNQVKKLIQAELEQLIVSEEFKILIECGDNELFQGQLDKEKSIPKLDIAVIKINRHINHNIPLLKPVSQTFKGETVAENEKSPDVDGQPTTTALTYEALEDQGILTELSRIFYYQASIYGLLRKVGFPRDQLPMFGVMTPLDVWQEVCQKIEAGLIEGGLEILLAAAASRYPHNPVFSRYKKLCKINFALQQKAK
ncbi:MAG: effector-associated domain EAD1-containing protein [Candidatus Parabeggiatoa sp.]|nr:effector-associated domain EAD1-containing protein [Candidatus Parabeggiatoa sp.]